VEAQQQQVDEGTGARSREIVPVVLATIVSFVLAAGFGAWLQQQPGAADERNPPPRRSSAARWTVLISRGAGVTPAQPEGGIEPPPVPTIFIVGTQEQADAILVGLHEVEAQRMSISVPPLNEQVALITSQEEEAQLRRVIQEQDVLRGDLGLPPTRVVDLRSQASNRRIMDRGVRLV
jgi:hypothetical protein